MSHFADDSSSSPRAGRIRGDGRIARKDSFWKIREP